MVAGISRQTWNEAAKALGVPGLPRSKGPLRVQTAAVFRPLLKKRPYRGAKGGRGSGKSHFFGEDLVLDMVSEHTRAVCAREVQNSIKDSSKQLIEDKIAALGLTRHFRITEREIICPRTDSLCIFRGLQNHTARSIKSLEGFNRFWADEAQSLSARSLELTIPTFRDNSAVMDFSWNPESPRDPVDKMFLENKDDPDFVLVEANYYDNPWFPDKLRKDMERDKRRDPDKYAHVWLGHYKQLSEARVFRNWSIYEFETPARVRWYHGADWGFAVDPTVLTRCFVGKWVPGVGVVEDTKGDTLFIDREVVQVGCEIDNTPALFDKLDPGRPGYAREWPIVADSARPETIAYMKRHGYPRIREAKKGAGSVEDGIEFLKNFDIVVHPRCVHTIDELSTYAYKIDPKTGEVLPILSDKDNHVIDALRYAVEGMRRGTYTLATVR